MTSTVSKRQEPNSTPGFSRGFRTMADADPDRWITVDAVGSIDRVAEEIHDALVSRGVL